MIGALTRRRFAEKIATQLENSVRALEQELAKVAPSPHYEIDPANIVTAEEKELNLNERLELLDQNIAKIEALREKGRPVEEKFRNMEVKYGRVGRHPGYPWYGEAVPYEDRIPHTHERMSKYSERLPLTNDLTEMLQLRSDLLNPSFTSNFVQAPNIEPDDDLNFEKGEVIYENLDAESGVALCKQLGYCSLAYSTFYMLHVMATGRAIYPCADEFNDIRSDGSNSGNNFLLNTIQAGRSWHDIEGLSVLAFISPLAPLAFANVFAGLNAATEDFVVKMQYNKDQDLVFVTKSRGTFWQRRSEEVYETAHLQVLPPTTQCDLGDLATDRIVTMTDMNSQDSFILYKDAKFWHPEHGDEFKSGIHELWS